MSRANNPYDNAFMESCFSRFKAELLQDGIFETIEDARTEIFEYIEMYYNTIRLHSSLSYKSPAQYEYNYNEKINFDMHETNGDARIPKNRLLKGASSPFNKAQNTGSALPKE